MFLCVTVLLLAGVLAYHNSFSVPFLFDDDSSIASNPTIRSLWPPLQALSPPASGETVSNRPLINFSLAVNYALSGLDVFGYHIVNLAIHLGAALALFGVVRHALQLPVLRPRFCNAARPIAFVAALWWMLHPLQTESVTYIVQRAESLMGLFYLLTLYTAIRSMESPRAFRWQLLAVISCLAGMAAKEVMVTAPVIVLLFDRTFVVGSFREAWQQRRWFHLALFSTWLPLGWLIGANFSRGGTAGFGAGVAAGAYWLTQTEAIAYYLKLSLWPHPLIFEYGTFWLRISDAMPYALIVVPLVMATLVALWRWPAFGFLGVWFFGILSPTSLMPGTIQMVVEHRMYLPLAAILVLVAIGLYRLSPRVLLPVGLAVAVVLGGMTALRNHDYRNAIAIWEDTVAKRPEGVLALTNLGAALIEAHQESDEAIMHLREAIRLKPESYKGYCNLGLALLQLPGHVGDAIASCEKALALQPNNADALADLGLALTQIPERRGEAIERFQQALQVKPNFPKAHSGLGSVLLRTPGRESEAILNIRAALRLGPDNAEDHVNLAEALSRNRFNVAEVVSHLQHAEALNPNDARTWNNIGVAWARIPGRQDDAITGYKTAIRLDPEAWDAHLNLAMTLQLIPDRAKEAVTHLELVVKAVPHNMDARTYLALLLADQPDRFREAVRHFEVVAKARPKSHDAHYNLGTALMRFPERRPEAIEQFETALRLDPTDAESHNNLGLLLSPMPGKTAEAISLFEAALRLKPDLVEAIFNIGKTLASVPGSMSDAIRHLEQALAAAPDYREAKELLSQLKAAK